MSARWRTRSRWSSRPSTRPRCSRTRFRLRRGLRALMRQDPDIIMVGEIRDLATAEMAIQAALTGHLVLSTLHTNDAPSAVMRLLELGVPPTCQRDPARRAGPAPGAHPVQAMPGGRRGRLARGAGRDRQALEDQRRHKPYRPEGCVDCRMTGFMGRMGLYELLTVTERSRKRSRSSRPSTPCGGRRSRTGCGRCGWLGRCGWPRG